MWKKNERPFLFACPCLPFEPVTSNIFFKWINIIAFDFCEFCPSHISLSYIDIPSCIHMWLQIKIPFLRHVFKFKKINNKISSSFPMIKHSIGACHLQQKASFHEWCFTACISRHKSLLVRQHWGAVNTCPYFTVLLNYICAASVGTKQQVSQINKL